MRNATAPIPTAFSDVLETRDPELTLTFRSGLAAYQESFIKGELVGRGWNGSGYTNPEARRWDPSMHWAPQAFWIELDGQLLRSGWQWEDMTQQRDESGLHVVVKLRHSVRPVAVEVHTHLDGTPVITRWLTITNLSNRPASLSAAFPWSGILEQGQDSPAPDLEECPYSVGYFVDSHWGNEGDFAWRPLPYAGYRIDGRYRRDRHRHPFFVVRNKLSGLHFVGTLAWSGGYCFEFDVDDGVKREGSRLWFRAGPDAPAPLRVLAPSETVTTPSMHLGLVIGDLDETIYALHTHLRTGILADPAGRPKRSWLVTAGIGPAQTITVDEVMHSLDTAAAVGAEVYILDAIWYFASGANWWSTVGDWQVNRDVFPDGLEPIRKRTHEKGMLLGLWMDAERIGRESAIIKEHPDWMARRYDGEDELRGLIDLTQPDVVEWLEAEIGRLITQHKIDLFRLDYNVGGLGAASCNRRDGFLENSYWRYYEQLYAMFERLNRRYPDVILQNCAGGGGRSDVGMVRYFDHTWVTDWQIAPRCLSIINGMTMALPPEFCDSYIGMGQSGQTAAELDFQARRLLFGHATVSAWLHLRGATPNPLHLDRIRHAVDLYKTFVRPMQRMSRIYHHTPELKGLDPCGWGVLELVSQARDHAVAGLFRLSDPAEPEYLLRFRGLDASRRYTVKFDNSGDACELDGYTLTRVGIPVRLESALTSELLIAKALDV